MTHTPTTDERVGVSTMSVRSQTPSLPPVETRRVDPYGPSTSVGRGRFVPEDGRTFLSESWDPGVDGRGLWSGVGTGRSGVVPSSISATGGVSTRAGPSPRPTVTVMSVSSTEGATTEVPAWRRSVLCPLWIPPHCSLKSRSLRGSLVYRGR